MASAVQFRGADQVIKAVQYKKIAAWSFWCGTSLQHKCEATEITESVNELTEWLEMIGESSNVIYTLRFYDKVPAGGINSKTPYDASFNFRLNADGQEINNGQYRQITSQNAILSELVAMRKQFDEYMKGGDEEEEPDKMETIAGKIIDHPMTAAIIGKIFKLDPVLPAGKVSGLPGERSIEESVEVLKVHDPALSTHLWKLSRIAETDKKGFAFLLGMLDQMNVK